MIGMEEGNHFIKFEIQTSCGSTETSIDGGEFRGGLWTNEYLNKGLEPKHSHKFTRNLSNGIKRSQTSHGYALLIRGSNYFEDTPLQDMNNLEEILGRLMAGMSVKNK